MRLDWDSFDVQQAIFEIRYPNAYLLWDRTGAIWHEYAKDRPSVQLQIVNPNRTAVNVDKETQAEIAIDKAHIIAGHPGKDAKRLLDAAKPFFSLIVAHLEITVLTRIGMRFILEKKCKDRDDATGLVHSFMRSPITEHRPDDGQGRLLDPEIAFRWEDNSKGYSFRFKSLERALELNLPPEFAKQEIPKIAESVAVFDLDHYIHVNTPIDRFDPNRLMSSWVEFWQKNLGEVLNVPDR